MALASRMKGKRRAPLAVAVALVLVVPPLVAGPAAAALPSFFTDTLVVGGLSIPRSLAFFPNGTLIVVENNGGFVFVNGSTRGSGGTLTGLSTTGEQGLLGVAVDPDYPTRPYIFVHYTTSGSPSYVQVARLNITNATGQGRPSVALASKLVLLSDMPNANTNHNGGTVRFGADKRLYVSIGDDAQGAGCTAQNLSFMAGKILRLNVNGSANPSDRLTLAPADNPFYNASNANASLVWALGLRNPFRFDIDRVTGKLYIGDVGQNAWEEVDISAGGENFGWPYFEANATYRTSLCPTDSSFPAWTRPIYAYPNPGGAAIIEAALYRGVSYPSDSSFPPEFEENPFFFDFYNGNLRVLRQDPNATTWSLVGGADAVNFATFMGYVTDMQVGPDGALWYTSAATNELRRLAHQSVPVVTTTSLPGGLVGQPYAAPLSLIGNSPPFAWSVVAGALPPGLNLASSSGWINGTPTAAGSFSFTVQVSSSAGRTATGDLSIEVIDDLVILTASLAPGTVGVPYADAVAVNGSYPPFAWRVSAGALPPGLQLSPSTGLIDGTPAAPGNFSFTVEVNSSVGRTEAIALWIEVADPVSLQPDFLPQAIERTPYIAPIAAGGGKGPFTFTVDSGALPPGLSLSPGSGSISGTPTAFGDWLFTVRATDSQGRTVTHDYLLRVIQALETGFTELPQGQQGLPYGYLLDALGGTPPYNWGLAGGSALPVGLSLDPLAGVVNGTPVSSGLFAIELRLSDAGGQVFFANLTLLIGPPPGGPPLIAIPALPPAYEGLAYDAAVTALGGSAPLTWSLTSGSLPPGLSFDPALARLSGVPSGLGDFAFTITVTDAAARNDSRVFSLRVAPVVRALSIVTSILPWVEVGLPYPQTLLEYSGQNTSAEVRWSAGGLPNGIVLDSRNGTLSGAAVEGGFFRVHLAVDDLGYPALHDERNLTLEVYRLSVNNTTLPHARVGVALVFALEAVGSATPAVWSITDGALPPGLRLDENGTLRGTPTEPGSFQFTARAAHPGAPTLNYEERVFVLTVDPAQGPGPQATIEEPASFPLLPFFLLAVLAAGALWFLLWRRRRSA